MKIPVQIDTKGRNISKRPCAAVRFDAYM